MFEAMTTYMSRNTEGVSRDSQLRALKLLKVVMEGSGREIFEFSSKTMKDRWDQLNKTLSVSKHFSLQEITPQHCTFFQQVRTPSPGQYEILSSFIFLGTILSDSHKILFSLAVLSVILLFGTELL